MQNGPQFDMRALMARQQINDALGVRPQPQQMPQPPQQQTDPRLAAMAQMQQGGMRPLIQPQQGQQPNLQAILAMLQQRQAQPNPLAALMARYQQRPQ